MDKPHAIIFSSGKSVGIAQAVKQNLEHDFVVDVWTEDFFNENNTPPINTFLKKLLHYDFAILILGDDDVQLSNDGSLKLPVPRDNVIFELGACMARMGTKKTFLFTPDDPKVKLPSYFKGLEPLTYPKRADDNYVAGTGTACRQVRERIQHLQQDVFHSDLPAVGLAYGYFYNFIRPIIAASRSSSGTINSAQENWTLKNGLKLSVIIPEILMGRNSVHDFMESIGALTAAMLVPDGRSISVYMIPAKNEVEPANILDIPTTLVTAEKVINTVDHFWGGGDQSFKNALIKREINAFARKIRFLIAEEQINSKLVNLVAIGDLKKG